MVEDMKGKEPMTGDGLKRILAEEDDFPSDACGGAMGAYNPFP
jgi:hypothetical protein